MKKILTKFGAVLVLGSLLVVAYQFIGVTRAAEPTIDLGASAGFTLLANQIAGPAVIWGNIGALSTDAVNAIRGFSLTQQGTYATSPYLSNNGVAFAGYHNNPTPTDLAVATADMEAAYADAMSRSGATSLPASIGNMTFDEGVYERDGNLTISDDSDITFRGGLYDTFIVRVRGKLTFEDGVETRIQPLNANSGSPQIGNITWVAEEVEVGDIVAVLGTILSQDQVVIGQRSYLNSRILSRGNITLNNSLSRIIPPPIPSQPGPEDPTVPDVDLGNVDDGSEDPVVLTGSGSLGVIIPCTTSTFLPDQWVSPTNPTKPCQNPTGSTLTTYPYDIVSCIPSAIQTGRFSGVDLADLCENNDSDPDLVPPMVCSPDSPTVTVGEEVTFTVSGGIGPYTWSEGGDPNTGNGTSFSTNFDNPGTKTVIAQGTLGLISTATTCSVEVISPDCISCGGGGSTTLTCSPDTQTAGANELIRFKVTGNANGNRVWSAPGGTPSAGLSTEDEDGEYSFATSYRAATEPGEHHTITVRADGESSNCIVKITESITRTYEPPRLPNAGLNPENRELGVIWGIIVPLALLLIFASIHNHYHKNTSHKGKKKV